MHKYTYKDIDSRKFDEEFNKMAMSDMEDPKSFDEKLKVYQERNPTPDFREQTDIFDIESEPIGVI